MADRLHHHEVHRPGLAGLAGGLDIDFTKLLHGEQELLFDRPLYVGDEIAVQATIVEASCKAGKAGPMDLVVVETVGHDATGARVFRARSLAVIRR